MEKTVYSALGESVWHGRLPNGLHIYVDEKPEYGKQFAFFAACYGGMDLRFRTEDGHWRDTPAGVAHFLEHKLFDTEDGNALQILAANGAEVNAFTASSLTGYYFEGTDGFAENLSTLLSFVSVPYFTKESVDKEQGIIAQEIRMGEDNPDLAIYYMLLEALYQTHPIRVKVIGSEQSIAQITADTLYECHGAFYHPGNMVLCVAGNVDAKAVERIARNVLPGEEGAMAERDRPAEPEQAAVSRVERTMEVSAPQFMIGFKGDAPGQGDSWCATYCSVRPRRCTAACMSRALSTAPSKAGTSRCPAVPFSPWGERAVTRTRCWPLSGKSWGGRPGGASTRPFGSGRKRPPTVPRCAGSTVWRTPVWRWP